MVQGAIHYLFNMSGSLPSSGGRSPPLGLPVVTGIDSLARLVPRRVLWILPGLLLLGLWPGRHCLLLLLLRRRGGLLAWPRQRRRRLCRFCLVVGELDVALSKAGLGVARLEDLDGLLLVGGVEGRGLLGPALVGTGGEQLYCFAAAQVVLLFGDGWGVGPRVAEPLHPGGCGWLLAVAVMATIPWLSW
jgi:hypothetical protein